MALSRYLSGASITYIRLGRHLNGKSVMLAAEMCSRPDPGRQSLKQPM